MQYDARWGQNRMGESWVRTSSGLRLISFIRFANLFSGSFKKKQKKLKSPRWAHGFEKETWHDLMVYTIKRSMCPSPG